MREKIRCAYVLSHHEIQFKALKYSLKSLARFISPKSIVIFYITPVNSSHIPELEKYDLRIVPNIYHKEDFYYLAMHRLYLSTLTDADKLIYFDNDTEIINSPFKLFNYDFDVGGRLCGEGDWRHIGTQFILFQNKSQQVLGPVWKKNFDRLFRDKKIGLYDEVSLFQSVKELNLKFFELPPNTITGYQIPESNLTSSTCVIHHSKGFYYYKIEGS